jgi:hypothetical protein
MTSELKPFPLVTVGLDVQGLQLPCMPRTESYAAKTRHSIVAFWKRETGYFRIAAATVVTLSISTSKRKFS